MNTTWLVPVLVPVVFILLRRLFPFTPHDLAARSLDELRAEYKPFEWYGLWMFVGFAPVAAVVCWCLFLLTAPSVGFVVLDSTYVLRPLPVAWAYPAPLLGIAASGPLSALVYRRILKDRYGEFLAYKSLEWGLASGWDVRKVNRAFYVGLAVVGTVLAVALANWYAVFSPSGIVLNDFLSLRERTYAYSDVTSIVTAPAIVAPNGDSVARRAYELRFRDASVWNSDPNPGSEQQVRQLMEAVSGRSGIPIVELALLPSR